MIICKLDYLGTVRRSSSAGSVSWKTRGSSRVS
uniref:Uncharacterized protein n=1 Tax=Utricularia reniformis TaxID=192314 RepID=A0A1Y0B376_9LAMI|nr:hypothetical protein AEK19_MT1660 [Utricularia reniformis]ART31844.1 hypothetical protein AEK19_MT1660 [Utricularia reniformis]